MPAFHFRLDTLLRLRETARDECRMLLADSQRADAALESRRKQLDREQEQLQSECRRKAGPGTVDLPRLVEAEQYATALREEQHQIDTRRKALAVEIERRRGALVEADRGVKTLEKLRDKQLSHHRQAEERLDVRRMDELVSQTRSKVGYDL